MAHYAVLDTNNIVTFVHVGKEEGAEGRDWEVYYNAKRTSYNTVCGEHTQGGTPFRKNYAGVGYTYDAVRDAFIAPQPSETAVLNETTCCWEEPA